MKLFNIVKRQVVEENPVKKLTIFDMPIIETKDKYQEMSNIIYSILGSDSFSQISAKVTIPTGSTQQDVARLLKENAPKKIKSILDLILVDNFENIIKFSAILFCESYETYCRKSLNQIVEDYSNLTNESAGKLLNLFTHAGF